jgi:2-C-methyl-D-erythritol 4-phosphate cytidylyltransferase
VVVHRSLERRRAAPEAIDFTTPAGMPLATASRKRFIRIQTPSALSYQSLVDFVPDHEPYEFATDIEITSIDGGTRVVMTVEPLHE